MLVKMLTYIVSAQRGVFKCVEHKFVANSIYQKMNHVVSPMTDSLLHKVCIKSVDYCSYNYFQRNRIIRFTLLRTGQRLPIDTAF